MMSNKKGSSTVFLIMILSSMILLVFAFIQATIRVSGESVGESVLLLAGRSVLTEFDWNLKERYGLFAVRGQSDDFSQKMDFYASPTFWGHPYYQLGEIRCYADAYRMTNPDVFEKEITEFVIYAASQKIIDSMLLDQSITTQGEDVIPGQQSGRVLRNQQIIESLPSYQLEENSILIDLIREGIPNWDEVFHSGSNAFMVNQYIMMYFKNALDQSVKRETFFQNEAEYILKGDYDDDKNLRLFRRDLVLLRNVINIGTIYANTEMRAQVLAAANIISPGPASLLTQILVAEAWALAEAENDVRMLEHGKKVPFLKTSDTWAIDIQSIIEGIEAGYVDTNVEQGLDYQGYLQIFLFFQNKNIKLTRMMDLMQINLQGTADSTFLMSEQRVGIEYEAKINYFTIRGATNY